MKKIFTAILLTISSLTFAQERMQEIALNKTQQQSINREIKKLENLRGSGMSLETYVDLQTSRCHKSVKNKKEMSIEQVKMLTYGQTKISKSKYPNAPHSFRFWGQICLGQ